jgi:hypothetical protein
MLIIIEDLIFTSYETLALELYVCTQSKGIILREIISLTRRLNTLFIPAVNPSITINATVIPFERG